MQLDNFACELPIVNFDIFEHTFHPRKSSETNSLSFLLKPHAIVLEDLVKVGLGDIAT